MAARRFPHPWSVEKQSACFVVPDHGGQALEDEPGRRTAAKLRSKDDGEGLPPISAKPPELVPK